PDAVAGERLVEHLIDLHRARAPEGRMLRGDGEARALGDLPGRSRQGKGHSIECRRAGFELAECAKQGAGESAVVGLRPTRQSVRQLHYNVACTVLRGGVLVTTGVNTSGFVPERLDRLREVIEEDVRRRVYWGAALKIARHGVIGFDEAIGFADEGHTTPLSTDSVFSIFSGTKAFINVLVLRAIERGQF